MMYTPGPWTYKFGPSEAFSVRSPANTVVAFMAPIGYEEQEDNARLIAAAPETLQQRDRLLAAVGELINGTEDHSPYYERFQKVKAAIAACQPTETEEKPND